MALLPIALILVHSRSRTPNLVYINVCTVGLGMHHPTSFFYINEVKVFFSLFLVMWLGHNAMVVHSRHFHAALWHGGAPLTATRLSWVLNMHEIHAMKVKLTLNHGKEYEWQAINSSIKRKRPSVILNGQSNRLVPKRWCSFIHGDVWWRISVHKKGADQLWLTLEDKNFKTKGLELDLLSRIDFLNRLRFWSLDSLDPEEKLRFCLCSIYTKHLHTVKWC